MPPFGIVMVTILVCGFACARPTDDPAREMRLRVGATWGLTSFLSSEVSGSSASAIRLVFDPTEDHIALASQDGKSVSMTVRPESRFSAALLARTFSSHSLVSARAVDENHIVAVFDDAESAAKAATRTCGGFALGPFEVEKIDERGVTLARKVKHAISEIAVREVSTQDEWRMFLGGQLDVVPISSAIHRRHLTGNPSVKLIDYRPQHAISLLFNTRSVVLKGVEARRYISSLVDRSSLVRLLGDEATTIPLPFASDALGIPSFAASSLVLTYLKSDIGISRTADAIRFQFAEHDIDVELAPRDINGLIKMEGKADMTLLPIPLSRRGFNRFLSAGHQESANITGYENHEFDTAYDAQDTQHMEEILKRDVPATQLYKQRYFAAIRSDLCLDDEPDPTSWRWIAQIYPCDEESTR